MPTHDSECLGTDSAESSPTPPHTSARTQAQLLSDRRSSTLCVELVCFHHSNKNPRTGEGRDPSPLPYEASWFFLIGLARNSLLFLSAPLYKYGLLNMQLYTFSLSRFLLLSRSAIFLPSTSFIFILHTSYLHHETCQFLSQSSQDTDYPYTSPEHYNAPAFNSLRSQLAGLH